MKIKKIVLENFKSIKKVEIDGLSQVNMIFGLNNSGKSNVLKFIDLLFSPKIEENNMSRVKFDKFSISEFSGKSIETPKVLGNFWEGIIENQPYIFHKNDWKNTDILFNVTVELPLTEIKDALNNSLYNQLKDDFFSTKSDSPNKEGKVDGAELVLNGTIKGTSPSTSEISLQSLTLENRVIYSSGGEGVEAVYFADSSSGDLSSNGYEITNGILSTMTQSVLFLGHDRYFHPEEEDQLSDEELKPDNFKNWLHNISLNAARFNDFKEIEQAVKNFKPKKIQGGTEDNSPFHSDFAFEFARLQGNIEAMVTNRIGHRFPLESFGTGIHQLLFILAKIAYEKPKIVIIEEIELNLSPKYQEEIIDHIKKLIPRTFSQLFFTTHTPVLGYRSEFIMHQVSINEKGETGIVKVGDEKKVIGEFFSQALLNFINDQKVNNNV